MRNRQVARRMTERQALKLSGLHDEVRRKALDMGFTPEQVETALIVTGGKTFKVVVDFLLKVRNTPMQDAGSTAGSGLVNTSHPLFSDPFYRVGASLPRLGVFGAAAFNVSVQ